MREPSRRHPLQALSVQRIWILVRQDGLVFGGLRDGRVCWSLDYRDALGFLDEVEAHEGEEMLTALGHQVRIQRYPPRPEHRPGDR
jgi:hypothetical protein